MIERHREAQSYWRVAVIVMLVIGLALAAFGYASPVGVRSGRFWMGLFIAALAIVPLIEMLDRRERANRLAGLRTAWKEIMAAPDHTDQDVQNLTDLIRKTHG